MSSVEMALEPFYVVDTHALIWYLRDDLKLTQAARRIFKAAEQHETMLVFSAIVFAEMYYANAKHHWFADCDQIQREVESRPYVRIIAFEQTHVLEFSLDAIVPEMHDRIITGVARRLGAPLITSDPLIIASGLVTIVW